MVIRALIFDFDGLMVDTETPRFKAWQAAFQFYGNDITLEEWLELAAHALDFDPCEELERRLGRPVDRSETVALRRSIGKPITDRKPLLPGVASYIESALARGWVLAVASNSSRQWVEGHLERLAVRSRFSAVRTGDDVAHGKPAPDVYLAALDALQVTAPETLALEDSPVGIRAARAAGLTCLGVPNDMTRHLNLTGAHLVLESLADTPLDEALSRLGFESPDAAKEG